MDSARIETEENGQRKTYVLNKEKFCIGRKPQNDLIFNLGDVSREHAIIEVDGDKFVIKDLGSRFGTFVNDKKIEQSTLVHGDRVRVGSSPQTQFVFKVGDTSGAKERTTQTSSISAPIVGDLRQVTLLLEGLRAMGSGRVLEEVLAIVLDSAIDLAGAERGAVMLANAKGVLEFKLARGRGGRTLRGEDIVTSHKIPEQVFRESVALVREDLLDADLKGKHEHTLVAGIRAAICVPLRLAARGDQAFPSAADMQTIGVLYVDSSQRAGFISPATRAALEAVADQAALAIQNARLFKESAERQRMEQDLMRAAEVQLSLLPPRLHSAGPLEVAGNTLPCRSVGGDFFDYFDSAGNLFVFAVADVSGKGMPAALLAAQTQGIFSTRAEVMESPAQVMTQVNRTLSRRATKGFVTMACAVIDGAGRLVTCNAGHNPPLVLRADGKIDLLEEGGLMLGPFENATFAEQSTTLGPGDLVVIYSDGVTECTDLSGEFYGEERVYDCLRECIGLTANAVLERIFRSVSEFSGNAAQADDITVLVVRYLGAVD